MSYTNGITPGDLEFRKVQEGSLIVVGFTCPRCQHWVSHRIQIWELNEGFEIECNHRSCRKPGERYGYKMIFDSIVDGICLGLSDRPLHEVIDG